MTKIKTIEQLLKRLGKFKTAKDVIETLDKDIVLDDEDKINDVSKQGFIYERLWDITIKFGLFKKDLQHYIQNANKLNILDFKELNKIFDDYISKNFISGSSGGYSDITFKNKDNVFISSCKYFANDDKKDIKDYEIQNLCPIIDANKDIEFKILLFVKDKEKFLKKRKTDKKSSNILIKYIKSNGNFKNIFDLNNLEFYFIELKKILEYFNYLKTKEDLNNFKKEYLKDFKKVFTPKFHQSLYINQVSKIIHKKGDNKNILIGALPRTGKTYIMGGIIKKYIQDFKKSSYNFLIITPAPTETIPQYEELFKNYLDFNNLSIINKTNFENYDKNSNNIFIFSKQKLDNDDKKYNKDEDNDLIELLKNVNYDIIFIDEAHQGMTTDKSKKLLTSLKKIDTYKIFITATYNKPINEFDIPDNHRIIWNLENVINLKRIANENDNKKFNKFIENLKDEKQFDKKIIDDILIDYDKHLPNLFRQYKNYPEPCLITTIWNNVDSIYKELEFANNDLDNYTFNMDTIFNIKKDKFENEEQLIELFHYFLGYSRKGIDYNLRKKYQQIGIIPRINSICENNCRTLQSQSLTSQLWFLPTNNDKLFNKIPQLLELLKQHFQLFFNQTLFLIAISSNKIKETDLKDDNIKIVKNKKDIFDCENDCENKYKNIVILTGEKFKVGVSLPNVDIVVLFNNSMSADNLYQMMFRSMTEINEDYECIPDKYCPKKKYGFIVDLNPQRTIAITNYISHLLNKEKNEEEQQYKVLELLNIDRDFYKSKIYDFDEDDKEKRNFSKDFFNKLNEIYDGTSLNIYKELDDFSIEIDLDYLENIKDNLKQINIDDKIIKQLIHKEGIDIKFKNKIIEFMKNNDIKDDEDEFINKVIDYIVVVKKVLSRLIPILSFTSGYDNYCIFNKSNKLIKKELKDKLNDINKNEDLKAIFMEYMDNEFNLFKGFDEYFKFFNELINNVDFNKEMKKRVIKKIGGSGEFIEKMNEISHRIQKKMYNIKDNPVKLITFINSFLKPTEKKKNENGEVFTPIGLVEDMINKLKEADPSVFANPNLKWLDPASGMGNFPVVVYMELMKGLKTNIKFIKELKDKNKKEKDVNELIRRWILEEMLYMVEYDKTNVFMMKRIFCGDKYKLNVFRGSFIKGDRYEKEGIDIFSLDEEDIKKFKENTNKLFCRKINNFGSKFDIIMGNPPFQATDENKKRKALLTNFWSIFINNSFNNFLIKNGYLLFITPMSWMSSGYKDKDIFYENFILFLNIDECSKWFKEGSKFSYYIIKKSNLKNKTYVICKYKSKIYKSSLFIKNNFTFLPSLLTKESLDIIHKFYNNKFIKISFEKSGEIDSYYKKDLLGECDKNKYIYKIRHTTKYTNICSSIKHPLTNKNKILMNLSGNLDPIYDNGKLGFTQAQIYYLSDNNNYVNILKSKLYKFVFKICKWSGFNILSMFKNIPYIETFKDDKTLYKKFELTNEEIKLIEEIVK